MLSPPPTSHPFLFTCKTMGGGSLRFCSMGVGSLLLSSVFSQFDDCSPTVLQIKSLSSPGDWHLPPGKTRDRLGFALWILKFAFWKNHQQKRGVELLDPLLGWAILRPASDSTRALDPAESQIDPTHSTREPIPTPPRSSDEPAPWLSSRGCASPQPGFESCFRF